MLRDTNLAKSEKSAQFQTQSDAITNVKISKGLFENIE